jgi:hypothetical protein
MFTLPALFLALVGNGYYILGRIRFGFRLVKQRELLDS